MERDRQEELLGQENNKYKQILLLNMLIFIQSQNLIEIKLRRLELLTQEEEELLQEEEELKNKGC